MKKKIAKLESKIKSMDKVTIRRGTQTEDQMDKVKLFVEVLLLLRRCLQCTEGYRKYASIAKLDKDPYFKF